MKFGAKYGNGRGLQGNTYALVTKNLTAGFTEKSSGITYDIEGFRSVSPEQISANIDELYQCAKENPHLKFFITYQYDPKAKNLNGYTQEEMLDLFMDNKKVPENIRIHESYKELVKKKLEKKSPEVLFFNDELSIYHQEHPSKFTYRDTQFISVFQFIAYSKAKMFQNEEAAQEILHYNKSLLAKDFISGNIEGSAIIKDDKNLKTWNAIHKKIGYLIKDLTNVNENIWREKLDSIMSVANREKFNQNPDFKNELVLTRDKTLAYANPKDTFNGIGLEEKNPQVNKVSDWKGENKLGNTLMSLREKYKLEPKRNKGRRNRI